MFTGLQFWILSQSFFLYKGLTRAVLASSEHLFSFMSLFIIFVHCESMTFLVIFKIFTGTPSGPVAFLRCEGLIILFISSTFAIGKSKFRVLF